MIFPFIKIRSVKEITQKNVIVRGLPPCGAGRWGEHSENKRHALFLSFPVLYPCEKNDKEHNWFTLGLHTFTCNESSDDL